MVSEEVSLAVTILSKNAQQGCFGRKRIEPPPNRLSNGLPRGYQAAAIVRPTIFPVQNSDRQNLFWTRVTSRLFCFNAGFSGFPNGVSFRQADLAQFLCIRQL